MILGFSDLHCNQAMTQLIKLLAGATAPSVLLSSGDDTVNGTAVERGCIRREAAIGTGQPFVVATGNHDSDITETQMKSDGMAVLDGAVVSAAGLEVLGDDDPERQIPFTINRTRDRAETEEQMAQRLVDVAAGRRTDVILVHQPAASKVLMATPNLPARLVLWGHFHTAAGPTVIMHDDGSWTVGMQQGTAGGVKQPTLSSFSTPFSPPLISADVYFYFRDNATGLITGVQPVHFLPDAKVVIDERIPTGDLATLPAETRLRLGGGSSPTPSPELTPSPGPTPTG
jgi:predicted phosphodiesterase